MRRKEKKIKKIITLTYYKTNHANKNAHHVIAGQNIFGNARAIRYQITNMIGSKINLFTQCSCPGINRGK